MSDVEGVITIDFASKIGEYISARLGSGQMIVVQTDMLILFFIQYLRLVFLMVQNRYEGFNQRKWRNYCNKLVLPKADWNDPVERCPSCGNSIGSSP